MIMIVTAVVFGVLAVLIYKGKTDLIHDYHQKKVTDKADYGRAFDKAMGVIAAAMALSGFLALFGEAVMWLPVIVLVIGMAIGIVLIIRVQRKYNGGMF
jgi:uncharacterized membrane protein